MRVIVARQKRRAEALIEALSLDEWKAMSFSEALIGQRIDEAVIIIPDVLTPMEAAWINGPLTNKLPPDKRVRLI